MSRALYTAEQFIKAIPNTGGIVTAIARRVGCDRHTARKFIDEHPTVAAAYRDETERVLDLAETQTIKAIEKGDMQTVRYYLSTKGRNRGYVERQEVTGADGGAVTLKVVYGDDGADDSTA